MIRPVGKQSWLGGIVGEVLHEAFWLNARGTPFTVQKALPPFNNDGSISMTDDPGHHN